MSVEKRFEEPHFQPFFIDLSPYPETEDEEPLAIISLPYSRPNRNLELISEGTVYHDVAKNSAFHRLSGIKALSFLSLVGPAPEVQHYQEFVHGREDHSYVVARLGELILRRNGYPEDEINRAVIAFLMHDIATPALGDATMKLDPTNLSEEDNFRATIGDREKALFAKYGTNVDEVEAIIKNKGVLGQVLDIADRLTYTAKDLDALIGADRYLKPSDPTLHEKNAQYLQDFVDIVGENPNFGELYKTIGIDRKKEQVFFSEPEMLSSFLNIRALLHERLYLHPSSQGRDLFVARLIEPFYSTNENNEYAIVPSKLRKMVDYKLMEELERRYSQYVNIGPQKLFGEIVNWYPQYSKFDTEEEAKECASQLFKNPNTVVLGVRKRRGFDPGTSYNVIHPIKRRVMSLRDYDPDLALVPEEIAASLPAVYVYYKELETDDDSVITQILRHAPQFKTF